MNEFIHRKTDSFQKIRDERNLIKQIEQDYEELCELWTMVKKGQVDISETEIILQKLAWIKEAIRQLKIHRHQSIEGSCWGNLVDIEKNVENILKKIFQ